MEFSSLNGPREAKAFKTGSKEGTGDPFLAFEGTCAGKIASNFNIFPLPTCWVPAGTQHSKRQTCLGAKSCSFRTCYIDHTPLEDILDDNNKQLRDRKENDVHQEPIKTTYWQTCLETRCTNRRCSNSLIWKTNSHLCTTYYSAIMLFM